MHLSTSGLRSSYCLVSCSTFSIEPGRRKLPIKLYMNSKSRAPFECTEYLTSSFSSCKHAMSKECHPRPHMEAESSHATRCTRSNQVSRRKVGKRTAGVRASNGAKGSKSSLPDRCLARLGVMCNKGLADCCGRDCVQGSYDWSVVRLA
jgi:hypothetical protein